MEPAMESDESLRAGVQNSLGDWTKKLECGGDVEQQLFYKKKLINKLRQAPVAIETDTANEQHYEVPTEFYLKILGKRLKYSSCYWPKGTTTLEQAEEVSLELICERAQVQDGQTVMDLGCGWGALGLYICEKFPRCQVVCVSNSNTQREHIESQASERGYTSRLTCLTSDANTLTTDQTFDRIISIEMLEHMKNYQILFGRISNWLNPGGYFFTQVLSHKEFAYEFDTKKGSDTEWMAEHFFSGGTMPSSDFFLYFQEDLILLDHWRMNGQHYSKTLEAWLERLDQHKDEVTAILAKTYGKDDAPKRLFNWRLFFIFCSEVFGYKAGNQWVLSFHLFKKRV